MFSYHPEEVLYTGEADPSPYELAMEEKRMERKMKQQAKKYGQEAIRSELKQELDAAVPTDAVNLEIHWGRRVLLRVRMLGACYTGLLRGSLSVPRTLGGLGGPPPVFRLCILNLARA